MQYNRTFLNGDAELARRGERSLDDTAETLTAYMDDSEVYDNGNEDMPPFYEYGLDFSYVARGTFKGMDVGYYRYQMSWGGPSDEIRIYKDGTIEYVFLDWFVGVGFDVSNEAWAQWLVEQFVEMGMVDWDAAYDADLENIDDWYEDDEPDEDDEDNDEED